MTQILFKYTRYILINGLILACIWVMASTNLNLTVYRIISFVYPRYIQESPMVSRISWEAARAEGKIQYAGWVVGIRHYWRMFSPPDKMNWYFEFRAVHQNGDVALLPLYGQSSRSFWQRNVVDFREAKYTHNMYWYGWSNNHEAQKYYIDYLCREYQKESNPITHIKIDYRTQNILSPKEAELQGVYLDPQVYSGPFGFGVIEC